MLNLNLKNLDRICLLAILSITLVSAGLVFHLDAKRRKGEAQKNHFISQQIKKLTSAEQNTKQLEVELKNSRNELAAFNQKIPEAPEFGAFLDQLDRRMKQKNLELISVQPAAEVEEKTFMKIPVRMIFNGTFINIFNMIHALETTGRTVVMENISIAKSDLDARCRVELLANIFSR